MGLIVFMALFVFYNDLVNQDDIYIGDILIVPGGVMPKKATPVINNQIPLANNFFIFVH